LVFLVRSCAHVIITLFLHLSNNELHQLL
jgi:hypothetical protein